MEIDYSAVNMKYNNYKWPKIFLNLAFLTSSFRDLRFISFLSFQDIFLILSFAGFNLKFLESSRRSLLNLLLIRSVFLLSVLILSTFIVSSDPINSSFNYLKLFFAFVILPVCLWFCFVHKLNTESLIYSYIIGAFFACSVSILFGIGERSNGRSAGLAGHPVFFGTLTGTAIVMLFSIVFKSIALKIVRYTVLGFLFYSLSLSASSTGFLIVGIASFIYFIFLIINSQYRRFMFFSFSAFIFGYVFQTSRFFEYSRLRFSNTLNPKTGFTTRAVEGTSTIEARWFSMKSSWAKIQDNPFLGHGLDTVGRITDVGLEPHNIFFLAWQTGGILLLSIIGYFLVKSSYALFKSINNQKLLATMLITTGWMVLMSEPLIYERSILSPIYLGILLALSELSPPQTSRV